MYPPEFRGVENGMQIAGTPAEEYLRSISFRNRTHQDDIEGDMTGNYGFFPMELLLSFYSVNIPSDESKKRKVDVIVARPEVAPLACILNFHSSASDHP
jgi:hypothetical protein